MPGPLEGITVLALTWLAQVQINRLREKDAVR